MIDWSSQRDRVLALASTNLQMRSEDRERARAPEARQIRAARAMLDWSEEELAKASGLTIAMLHKYERGTAKPGGKARVALEEAFSAAGIVLLPVGDGPIDGPGVRLRKSES